MTNVESEKDLYVHLVKNFGQPLQALLCGGEMDPCGVFFRKIEVVKGPQDRLAVGSVVYIFYSRPVLFNNRNGALRKHEQEIRATFQVVQMIENSLIEIRRCQAPLKGNIDTKIYGDSPRTIRLRISSSPLSSHPCLQIAMESDVPAGASYRSVRHFCKLQYNSIAHMIDLHIKPQTSSFRQTRQEEEMDLLPLRKSPLSSSTLKKQHRKWQGDYRLLQDV